MVQDRPKTFAEIDAMASAASALLAAVQFVPVYTIDDYPIGRRDRGKCEMSVKRQTKKGYRTSRRTTDKYGRWCKSKESVYVDSPIVVVTGSALEHEAAWLRTESRSLYLQWANGDSQMLMQAPHYCAPRRHDETVTWTTRAYAVFGASEPVEVKRETETLKADPPEMIALWDHYMAAYQPIFDLVRSRALQQLELTPA